jgi:hypothetical protein
MSDMEKLVRVKVSCMMIGVGIGAFMALQGCAGAEYTADAGDAGDAGGAGDVGEEQEAVDSSCYSSFGVPTTKAALAVAMALELGRWDPLDDLTVSFGSIPKVVLRPSSVCLRNGCAQTKGILGQADFTPDLKRFGSDGYTADLSASLGRQQNLITYLTHNHPDQLPPLHRLTPVGTMTPTGVCGPRFIFQVDNISGTALTSAQAANMSQALCFFGQNTAETNCGGNPFVGFAKTQVNCPSGRVCVAIDPDDGDVGSAMTTSSAGAPTYTLDRLWDPTFAKLNTACIKTSGSAGKMLSMCQPHPNTCGFLYCM